MLDNLNPTEDRRSLRIPAIFSPPLLADSRSIFERLDFADGSERRSIRLDDECYTARSMSERTTKDRRYLKLLFVSITLII